MLTKVKYCCTDLAILFFKSNIDLPFALVAEIKIFITY